MLVLFLALSVAVGASLSTYDPSIHRPIIGAHPGPKIVLSPSQAEELCEEYGFSVRQRPVKVADAFAFNDELDLLEIKLYEYAPVIDYVFISESAVSHQNEDKPLYFAENKHKFDA